MSRFYGEQILQRLAEKLQNSKTFSYRSLKLYKQFYLAYKSLGVQIYSFVSSLPQIGQSLSAQLYIANSKEVTIRQTVSAQLPTTVKAEPVLTTDPQLLFNKLSFSHLTAIMAINDPLQRTFYETMAIRGTWSVRELQRQIDSNYYIRSGWSEKPEALAKMVSEKAEVASIDTDLKSPFVFEFLGLKAKDVWEESDLESAIIDHLQEFILELGMGFCFEARQQKMLIDDRYYKADLVFYHRILKRHVIFDQWRCVSHHDSEVLKRH